MLGRLIRTVRIVRFSDNQIIGIVGLSDSRTVNLLEMSDRLIRMVGMVGFSDSLTVRFSELLDNWIIGLLGSRILYFTVPHGFPWTAHGLLIVLMECSWSVHGVLMECSWSVYGVFMECS